VTRLCTPSVLRRGAPARATLLRRSRPARVPLQAALRFHPNFSDACNNLASVHAQMGDVPRAIEYYTAALRIDPSLVNVLQNLGDLLLLQGPLGLVQSQKYFREALRLKPNHARAWRGLGDGARESGEFTQAIAFYSQVRRVHKGERHARRAADGALLCLLRRGSVALQDIRP
jgi:tetratricopeptide (TPR) repeat protein